ncbi:hypothetical protein ACFQ1M_15320 [Sungkyunkwania multivorans]|uniref:Uncharacterized protein n=1 Tax=Sungkyunkwania multivorans TaxID=1173618 RepID=A0ABW3D0M6_9FLAO
MALFQSFGIGIDDAIQMDELIEHARFHQEKYGDNMLVFISKHYGALKDTHEQEHQEEKGEHEQLPFQNSSHTTPPVVLVQNISKTECGTPELLELTIPNFYYQAPSSSLHSEGLLHPPQLS